MTPATTRNDARRVLVLEDDPHMQRALRGGLRSEGWNLTIAGTLRDAILSLSRSRFDLVLLDLSLPDGDERRLLSTLRERAADLPLVVITARPELLDGEAHQPNAVLEKPFSLHELSLVLAISFRLDPLG